MKTIGRGLWSGVIATGAMTLSMFYMHRKLPERERSPLAPAILTNHLLRNVARADERENLTLISHFGYGASFGLLFSWLGSMLKAPPLVRGNLFGMGVWSASYLGWIPAFGFRPSAFNTPWRRNAMMILAHLVWGASMAFTENALRESSHKMLDGRRKAPEAE